MHFLLLIALALPVSSLGAMLTFEDAHHYAIERSQQLAAQDASIRSSREMAVAARARRRSKIFMLSPPVSGYLEIV